MISSIYSVSKLLLFSYRKKNAFTIFEILENKGIGSIVTFNEGNDIEHREKLNNEIQ